MCFLLKIGLRVSCLVFKWGIFSGEQLKYSSTYFKTTTQKPADHIWAQSEHASVHKSFEKKPQFDFEQDYNNQTEHLETGDQLLSKNKNRKAKDTKKVFVHKNNQFHSPAISQRDRPDATGSKGRVQFTSTVESPLDIKDKGTLTSSNPNQMLMTFAPKQEETKRRNLKQFSPLFKSLQYQKNSSCFSLTKNKEKNKFIATVNVEKDPADQELGTCTVCFEKPPDAVFMSCGHGGICYGCSIEVWKKTMECYLCRKVLILLIK